ncbi:MAG: MotA/TolQ/ExbB proton channel family protein [Fibrobacteraceae bacterium]|nr:MotA/TolQ/ExbB proton channel family protein [Fibrobacteraceae bacterium]
MHLSGASNYFYIIVEALRGTYFAGGVVMLPILVTGVIGFFFLYSSWWRIGRDFLRNNNTKIVDKLRYSLKKGELEKSKKVLKDRAYRSIVCRELSLALKQAEENPSGFQDYMQVRLLKTKRYMEKGNQIVAVMTAAAPLLGLLGTVTGMVSTFEVITLYGNQNPVLMADGISEALISTQSGLLVAFPLTLLKQRLDERINLILEQMQLGATVIGNYYGI